MPRKLILLLIVAMIPLGCAPMAAPPPHSLAEYTTMRTANPGAYPRQTILLNNLQRVLDSQQGTSARVASLDLVLHLGAHDTLVRERLSTVLAEPYCPQELHHTVLSFLLENDYPGLAGYVVPTLSRTDLDPLLRDAILQWLTRHPSTVVLAEIVKLWADEPAANGADESRFRHIVEQISGLSWDQAILAGIDSTNSFPRGRALEILARRIDAESLKRRVLLLRPKTPGVTALQVFIENFSYLPITRGEFAAVATLFTTRLKLIHDAAGFETHLRGQYGYRFDIRDFHLLSQLPRDPLRTMFGRTQLTMELAESLFNRSVSDGGGDRNEINGQLGTLTIVDLWNLYLLSEMLGRPRMQLALKVVSNRNRAAPNTADEGLVFYQHGQAEAVLYPPNGELGEARLIRDGRDALCRFRTHFRKVYNSSQAGPNPEELQKAKADNFYGLVLTSLSETAFMAHYYNPSGQIISLGEFPFSR